MYYLSYTRTDAKRFARSSNKTSDPKEQLERRRRSSRSARSLSKHFLKFVCALRLSASSWAPSASSF